MKYRVTVRKRGGGPGADYEVKEVVADRYEKDGDGYRFIRDGVPIATYFKVREIEAEDVGGSSSS